MQSTHYGTSRNNRYVSHQCHTSVTPVCSKSGFARIHSDTTLNFKIIFSMTYTTLCVAEDLNILNISLFMQNRGNKSSRFSLNSEANASELRENIEEMLLIVDVRITKKGLHVSCQQNPVNNRFIYFHLIVTFPLNTIWLNLSEKNIQYLTLFFHVDNFT